ncbi:toprim domain-containing protein [Mariniflexile sp. AS56]|uniref:toprim domain-containing protein n=1 Tax=Mariniflexile sp. AS56 TaxID=3063957 RepID=UPI0026ED9F08|nr:toprim domain-containing protein [Mariniflexile sp. AS56]MDO7172052.1 toprim domain-containing protein [Mariniflexile sp. AS56]
MKRKINCETARNFSVVNALEKLGHFPKKTTEKEAWFLSPFRSEAQASFKVSKTNNRWYDHGEGIGGNVIDLVCKILKCSIKEALDYLNNDVTNFSFQQQKVFNDNETQIDITKIQELTHPALIQYLSSRGISIAIAKIYCKEVWYRYKNIPFFAIGLQNHKNGWELRNKFYKNSSSPKSYTYIQNNPKQLIILEGMFDLLSLATIDEDMMNISDIIILNSIAFIKQIEKHISKYELVHLYLDNDSAGKNAIQYLINTYNHVIDKSSFYKNHKDLNDLLRYEK